ncbi:MAG: DNA repair protein RadA [Lachnospiraceae bacterium]|nr:DNA repair protein RadA [Lachnospiraceae bacterium]
MAGKSKEETVFFCTECGYESRKWMGQCPSCRSWSTFSEEPVTRIRASGRQGGSSAARAAAEIMPVRMDDISTEPEERISTGFDEFSRVLGGGIVPGSLILVGGDPGVGKSTLLLQTAAKVAEKHSVIYISGEESLKQIRLRARRIGEMGEDLRFVAETDIDRIISMLEKEKPDLCVIDSIQTMSTADSQSVPGSVSQVRECSQRMMICAKQNNIATFLVGHVTKEGTVAGPRVLEHIVDTVLYFESGEQFGYRVLRSAKNRFGSTNEIGVFEMSGEGLKEVLNPSEYLLEGRFKNATGAVVTCLIEGSRAMLMEVQGLAADTQYGIARRQANGMDYNRMVMLLAVLQKRAGVNIGQMDVYVNIAGGMKITQPSADLAVILAVMSSLRNVPVPEDTVVFGEVGLSGEVRSVPQASDRIREAERLGFRRVIMPAVSLKGMERPRQIETIGISFISEMFALL